MSFKILNDKAVYISLDLWNKIWTMKWTNGEISKWRGSLSTDFAVKSYKDVYFIYYLWKKGFSFFFLFLLHFPYINLYIFKHVKKHFLFKIESLHFMVQIKYHRSNSVQIAMSFKILNDNAVYISLDLWNKIWIMKWTNGEIFKWRWSLSVFPIASLARWKRCMDDKQNTPLKNMAIWRGWETRWHKLYKALGFNFCHSQL